MVGLLGSIEVVDHGEQIVHRRAVRRIVAGVNELKFAVAVDDEVSTQLGGVFTMGVIKGAALEPAFDIDPNGLGVPGTQPGTLQLIGFVDFSIRVQ